MRGRKKIKIRITGLLSLAIGWWCVPCLAQTPPPPARPATTQEAAKPRKAPTATTGPVIVETRPPAPQVVTILHRLTGLKMFRLLLRSSDQLGAIAKLDEAFKMTDDVHTNVIAGLALDDGQTIAAWLPEAEAEMGPSPAAPPSAPRAPKAPSPKTGQARATVSTPTPPGFGSTSFFERPDLTVVARDGKRLIARYIGLDAVTGLSVLKLSEKSLLNALDAREEAVSLGQRMRLFAPEPVTPPESHGPGTIYVRIGETEGRVVDVARAPSGTIARVKIKSPKLSAANIGGIAINDAGETVGIVELVDGHEATVLPSALVRSAARRVTERQSSVPRPWLGVGGEAVEKFPLEQMVLRGWELEGAKALAESHRGIFLTSVAPGSPAAVAALRPGDVILQVNDEDVRSAYDFSWLLEEAGPGGSVSFTITRPDKVAPEAIELTLSESPDPFFGLRQPWAAPRAEARLKQFFKPGSLFSSLIAQGIETIALKPQVALRFGSKGGLLVVYVHPATAAFRAGLRSGDVIEAIDGQKVSLPSVSTSLLTAPIVSYSLDVVRNRERVIVKVDTASAPR
jgi:serine protease Do